MKVTRTLFLAAALTSAFPAAAAQQDADEGWSAFGHALTLVQMFVRIAAQSDDPQASTKAMDDVLAGRNTEANRAVAGLLEDATADMPTEHRDRVYSIGRDLAALMRKEASKTGFQPTSAAPSVDQALQARKDLTAMGLRYYDATQFIDAVKRDDALAVELFIAGKGVNVSSRDRDGKSAADIARANGNTRLAELLAKTR
jgi:hypothetical protein